MGFEISLVIFGIIMLAEAVLITYLYYTMKNVMENQLIESESTLKMIDIIKNLNERINTLDEGVKVLMSSEIEKAKKAISKFIDTEEEDL